MQVTCSLNVPMVNVVLLSYIEKNHVFFRGIYPQPYLWNCGTKRALRIQDLYLNWHLSWFNNHTISLYKFAGAQTTKSSSKMQSTNKSDKLQCHYYEKTKMRTNDFTPMAGPFLCSTNIFTGLIYKKCNKILSHRHLKRSRTQKLTSQTQLKNNYLL